MKKYFVAALLLAVLGSKAQSPRLVLVEEFTGETCVPCFISNPGMNAILDSKPGEVISLKYQNNIPSTGPNLYTYNIPDITNRTAFYANNYSPHAFIDGNYWNGNAAALTGALLDTRYAVDAPFEVITSHTFSPANDIIYTHVVIRATEAFTGTTMRARIAVAERDIYGYTSITGEDHYQHVMRKLLPDGNGTIIPNSWAVGDSVVIDEQWTIAVPTSSTVDMPLWPMLEVIAWVQDNSTKQIIQAGHSPAQVAFDPMVTGIANLSTISCTGTIAPELVVTNKETMAISSLDIEYSLDNQTPTVLSWTGNISPGGGTANIAIPSLSITPGAHSLSFNITNVNGSPDLIPTNNSLSVTAGQPLPSSTTITENFAAPTFPPPGWLVEDPDFLTGWKKNTASGGCAKIDFYNSPPGQLDYLYALTPADLSAAVNPSLSFILAHKQYAASVNDRLDILASTDCGQTWNSVWNKSGAALATVTGYVTSAYSPGVTHWRSESVDLSGYAGQQEVLIAFKGTSAGGNNAYVDNINLLDAVVGIASTNDESLVSIYPMPSNGNMTLEVSKIKTDEINISITDISGKLIKELTLKKSGNVLNLDLASLENGTYFLKNK